VREEDGLTLIDAMIGGSADRIVAGADTIGVPIVRSSRRATRGCWPKDMTLDPDEPRDKLRGGYPGTRSKPDRTVDSGDRVG
jgi:hypothetical protein